MSSPDFSDSVDLMIQDQLSINISKFCSSLAENFVLTPEENALNQHLIDGTEVPYSRYNLYTLLLGYCIGSLSSSPESYSSAIDFILSDSHLSRFCFHNIDSFDSLDDLIRHYLSRPLRFRRLPGLPRLLDHDRPYKKPGRKPPPEIP